MNITNITIESEINRDERITIERLNDPRRARVIHHYFKPSRFGAAKKERLLGEVGSEEREETRHAIARTVAKVLWGGGTNSMVHDVMSEIDRIAGC